MGTLVNSHCYKLKYSLSCQYHRPGRRWSMKLEWRMKTSVGHPGQHTNQKLTPTKKRDQCSLAGRWWSRANISHTHVCTRASKAECFQSFRVLKFSVANHVLRGVWPQQRVLLQHQHQPYIIHIRPGSESAKDFTAVMMRRVTTASPRWLNVLP